LAALCSRVRFSRPHANKIDDDSLFTAAREISCGAPRVRDNGGRFPSMRPPPLLLALVLVVTVAAAHAGPRAKLRANREPTDKDAIALMQHGNRALGLGEYDTAISDYKQGALLDPVPLFWLNLGLGYRRAQRYSDAIDAYREFLYRSSGDADPDGIRAQVEALIPQLEAARDAPPKHPEPSTETGVDTPPPTSASANGAKPVALAPAPLPTATASSSNPSASTTAIIAPKWSRWHDVPGWGLAGAGVIAAGVGVGLLANASSLDGQADRETDFAKRDQLRQSASSRRTAGEVTAAAGAVLLVGAIARFALVGSPSRSPSSTSLQLTPGPGDVGLGFAIGF
jgi:hypothetical protein